jgi:[NiFe] hydrogenase diaphorase moiety small subunit
MADKKKKLNKKPQVKKSKISGKVKVKKIIPVKSKTGSKKTVKSKSPVKAAAKPKDKSKLKAKSVAKKVIKPVIKASKKIAVKSKNIAKAGNKTKAKSKPVKTVKSAIKPKTPVKVLKKATPAKKEKAKIATPDIKIEINFSIDGVDCNGQSGQSIVEAAKNNGIYIPVLCYYEGMKPAGICRMCTVKVNGRFMAACTTPVAEGMIVENNIPELENMRKAIVEMLFVEGNHMCPTCEKSGNCELQALGYRYQMSVPRFPYQFPDRKIDATYSRIMIDNNRCVHCRRCVRDIITKDGKHIFAMTERSGKSTIIADHELEKNMSDDLAAKAMYQCPVGAILKKEVGFAVPIGKRKFDKAPIGSDIHK